MLDTLRARFRLVRSVTPLAPTSPRGGRGQYVDPVDALACAGPVLQSGSQTTSDANFPPGYVKSYDEGRPRK